MDMSPMFPSHTDTGDNDEIYNRISTTVSQGMSKWQDSYFANRRDPYSIGFENVLGGFYSEGLTDLGETEREPTVVDNLDSINTKEHSNQSRVKKRFKKKNKKNKKKTRLKTKQKDSSSGPSSGSSSGSSAEDTPTFQNHKRNKKKKHITSQPYNPGKHVEKNRDLRSDNPNWRNRTKTNKSVLTVHRHQYTWLPGTSKKKSNSKLSSFNLEKSNEAEACASRPTADRNKVIEKLRTNGCIQS